MRSRQFLACIPLSFFLMAGVAHAQNNEPPPLGAILDLNGQPIPSSAPQLYTVDFIAGVANTAITFAFRDDPLFISFSEASVINLTANGNTNLLTNGDFSGATYTSNGNSATPAGWTYANIYGARDGGGGENRLRRWRRELLV